jgi:hypothetical protein
VRKHALSTFVINPLVHIYQKEKIVARNRSCERAIAKNIMQQDLPNSGLRFDGSGVNEEESMAFGMTETRCGLTVALNTVFSLLNNSNEQM